uniref:hypothetical protein n=2 Tax=Barnesiella intestinihominis TaxID=487174 RepID=UPI003FEF1DE5
VTTCHLPYITPQHPAMLRGTAGEEFYISSIGKTEIPRNVTGHGRREGVISTAAINRVCTSSSAHRR